MKCAFDYTRKSVAVLMTLIFLLLVSSVSQAADTTAPAAKKPAAKASSKKSTDSSAKKSTGTAAKKPAASTKKTPAKATAKKSTTKKGTASTATTKPSADTKKKRSTTTGTKTGEDTKKKTSTVPGTKAGADSKSIKADKETKATKSTAKSKAKTPAAAKSTASTEDGKSTAKTKSKGAAKKKTAKPKAEPEPEPVPEPEPTPEPVPAPAPPVEVPAKAGEVRDYTGISFVKIDAGSFQMGSAATPEELVKVYGGEPAQYEDERPAHAVALTRGFWMGRYEITNAQFEAFVAAAGYQTDAERENTGRVWDGDKWVDKPGANWRSPGWTTEPTQPVTLVSWNDAQAYLEWLNTQNAGHFRLPTEAEWEYCCRAGASSAFSFGDNVKDLPDFACCRENSGADVGGKPFAVGARKPNAWGIYDMHGNLLEWCQDGYDPVFYGASSAQDPQGPDKAGYRVMRGGSWFSLAQYCRCSSRTRSVANYRFFLLGFRICRDE